MKLAFFVGLLLGLVTADPVVELTHGGGVRGVQESSQNGTPYFAYKAIPYIEPPLGKLRFTDPVPHGGWTGVRDAVDSGPACINFDPVVGMQMTGQEDCVVINVYTPQDPSSGEMKKRPVLLWIHGGGFVVGTALFDFYNPSYLLDRDVVVVTFNYRLNILGFLTTEDSHAPGNYGLKDQTEALKWVQKNIARFGGDPSRVTIFGESAGGASVHFQMLSPLSKGLFQAGIAQSGSAFNPWAIEEKGRSNAVKLAELVGCPSTDSAEMLDCLREKPAEELVRTLETDFFKFLFMPLSFGPRVDRESSNPFLPRTPMEIMESGDYAKVPLMTGLMKDEGLLLTYPHLFDKTGEMFDDTNDSWESFWCELLLNLAAGSQADACRLARERYLGDLPISSASGWHLTRAVSDRMFDVGVRMLYEMHSRHAPTFVYTLRHEASLGFLSVIKLASGVQQFDKPRGVAHADDLPLLFKIFKEVTKESDPDDFNVKEQFMDIWTGFAYDKRPPVANWPEWTAAAPIHWVIDPKPVAGESLVSNHVMAFWKSLNIDQHQTTTSTAFKSEL